MRHCNKKFALKWHKVRLKGHTISDPKEWRIPSIFYRKELKQLPSNGRFRILENDDCCYVENEEDAIMLTLMYA